MLPIVALALLLFVSGCGKTQGEQPDESTETDEFVKIINVEVENLLPTAFEEFIRLTGTVKAEKDVILSAEESGRVVRFFVDKGDAVRRGAPIAKIDDAIMRATVVEAEAESALAAESYERQREVWEEGRIGTELAYLEKKRRAAQAASRLQVLRMRLAHTTVRSPFDGTIEARYIDAGEMASVGAPVVRVLSMNELKVEVGVPERFAPDVRVGTRVHIVFDVLGSVELEGRVRFAGNAVDPENRTFPIEIDLDDPQGVIKPEMITNVRVVRNELENVIVAPQQALRQAEDGFVAYVAVEKEEGAFAEERRLVLGPHYADRVVVEEGLRSGDRLITRGQMLVAEGSRIRIVEPMTRSGNVGVNP
jgi:membrane fusion protein (multidrug efflux system)